MYIYNTLRAALALVFASSAALAQGVSPAQMGITPTTDPEVVQILDKNQNWVTVGYVTGGAFSTIGGPGIPGYVWPCAMPPNFGLLAVYECYASLVAAPLSPQTATGIVHIGDVGLLINGVLNGPSSPIFTAPATGSVVGAQLQAISTGGAAPFLPTYSVAGTGVVAGNMVQVATGQHQLYTLDIYQTSATPMAVKLYDLGSAPAACNGVSVVQHYPIAASAGPMHLSWVNGLAFQNGIFYCIVGQSVPPAITDQGTVAVGLIVEGSYK